MQISKTHRFTGFVLAALHLTFTFCIYLINVANGVSYATILWFFLAVLDFPVGLGVGWKSLQVAGNYRWNNELMPLFYFGTIGTLWWFFLGVIFSRFISALRKTRRK